MLSTALMLPAAAYFELAAPRVHSALQPSRPGTAAACLSPPRMLGQRSEAVSVTRRSALALVLGAAALPPAPASAKLVAPEFFRTESGIVYFDDKLGADPPPPASRQRLWTPIPETINTAPAAEVNPAGTRSRLQIRRGSVC